MRPLSPQTEGVEELVVDALYNLAHSSHPPSQALGPGLAAVAFRRMDEPRPVALLPALVVLDALETLVCYVGAPADRAYARKPGVWLALTAKKVSARCWSAVEAAPKPKPVMS